MQWQVALNNDSFDRAGITKDCQDAVCEYIWNSFEAGASKVAVSMMGSPLQEAMSLVVADNGMGIAFDNLDKTFGTFLSSLKNNATMRLKSQSNKGKGRFSYLSFSHSAEWHTVYRADSKLKQYTISTNSANRSQFDTTEPVDVVDITETGTTVTFSLEDSNTVDLLSFGAMKQKLLEEFAWYLFLNKDIFAPTCPVTASAKLEVMIFLLMLLSGIAACQILQKYTTVRKMARLLQHKIPHSIRIQ